MNTISIDENTRQALVMFAFFLFMAIMIYSLSRESPKKYSISDAKKNIATPPQNTAWDKLKIISMVLSSIAAIIYAVSQLINSINQ